MAETSWTFDEVNDYVTMSPQKAQVAASYDATSLWLMHPKAVYSDGKTFVGYLDDITNDIEVAVFTHSTKTWANNDTGLNGGTVSNAHSAPSVFIDSLGYINILTGDYTTSAKLRFIRSTNPNDASAWDSVVDIDDGTNGKQNYTYPTMHELDDGTLVVFARCLQTSSSREEIVRWRSTDNGSTWDRLQTVMRISSSGINSYYRTVLESTGRLHMIYNYRPNPGNWTDCWYMYSDNPDAVTSVWKDVDDNTLTIPTDEITTGHRVFDKSVAGWDHSYISGFVAIDGLISSEPPYILLMLSHNTGTSLTNTLAMFNHFFGWQQKTIEVNDGLQYESGVYTTGAFWDFDFESDEINTSTFRVCGTIQVAGKSEVYEWLSIDKGTNWGSKYILTTLSTDQYTIVMYPVNHQPEAHIVSLFGSTHHNNAKDIVAIEHAGDAIGRMELDTPDWTIEGWLKPADHTGSLYQFFLSWGLPTDTPNINMYMGEIGVGTATLDFAASVEDDNGDGSDQVYTSTDEANFTTWKHIALTRRGTTFQWYVDGLAVGTPNVNSGVDEIEVADLLYFGSRSDQDANRFFGGSMSDWAIWDRVLDTDELALLQTRRSSAIHNWVGGDKGNDPGWHVKMEANDYTERVGKFTVQNNGSTAGIDGPPFVKEAVFNEKQAGRGFFLGVARGMV